MVTFICAVAVFCLALLLGIVIGKIAKGPRWYSQTMTVPTEKQWKTNDTYLDREGNAWLVISSTPNEDGFFDTVMGKE